MAEVRPDGQYMLWDGQDWNILNGPPIPYVTAPPTDSPPDGTIKVGSDSKLYVRIEGAWKSVALT